jgi:microsomal dipeptidase-like Zn-dependent dipeptidase
MENEMKFADFHCHPTLKTYGHSFSETRYGLQRRSIWFKQKNSFLRKQISRFIGLTKFSQADFTSLKAGNVKIVTVSLYPFEKGFFINLCGSNPFSAWLANVITGVSYYRIRNIQQHVDYFSDLEAEYYYLTESVANDHRDALFFPENKSDFQQADGKTAIMLAIEGAHVFNSGLKKYGKTYVETEMLSNVYKVKNWKIPPKTITFAHNFINDFCGHAKSLDPLGPLVDQSDMLDDGFTELGWKMIDALLDTKDGKLIYPDLKHMSLRARKEYYDFLDNQYPKGKIPLIVSHGAVTGTSWDNPETVSDPVFSNCDINFYDEEIIMIAKSHGIFAIQLDGRRLAQKKNLKKLYAGENPTLASAEIVWKHIQYIALLLDENDLPSWNITCIGSDFDGTISPLPGIYAADDLPQLAAHLLPMAERFIANYNFKNDFNKTVSAYEVVEKFCFRNIYDFYSNTF